MFDPGEVVYLYENPAGLGLIGIRGVCWLWFIYVIFLFIMPDLCVTILNTALKC